MEDHVRLAARPKSSGRGRVDRRKGEYFDSAGRPRPTLSPRKIDLSMIAENCCVAACSVHRNGTGPYGARAFGVCTAKLTLLRLKQVRTWPVRRPLTLKKGVVKGTTAASLNMR